MKWHDSVLVEEVKFFFKTLPQDATIIDATLGDGGHSLALLQFFEGKVKIIGIDRDPVMLERARVRLQDYSANVSFYQGGFLSVLSQLNQAVHGVLFDFGVASFHFDESGRGFTFRADEPLDMRLDPSLHLTAAALIRRLSEPQLREIFREFGEERFAAPIARALKACRGRIDTTGQLAAIVQQAIPGRPFQNARLNPATRVFQALRIAVNNEIGEIEGGLKSALKILNKGGRVVAISFHSIEDRQVKNIFRDQKTEGVIEILTKKPIIPSSAELARNPRSRSAKLRAAQKN